MDDKIALKNYSRSNIYGELILLIERERILHWLTVYTTLCCIYIYIKTCIKQFRNVKNKEMVNVISRKQTISKQD